MQLTIFTDYGLRSLMYLAANSQRRCSVKELSDYYSISRNHLVKVIHRLSKLGYINSKKGKNGGIKLAKNAETLKLGDIVLALEQNMDIVECFNKDTNKCNITNGCGIKHYLFDAKKAFLKSLNQHTLTDAIQDMSLFFKPDE